jgi:hypothetical protein
VPHVGNKRSNAHLCSNLILVFLLCLGSPPSALGYGNVLFYMVIMGPILPAVSISLVRHPRHSIYIAAGGAQLILVNGIVLYGVYGPVTIAILCAVLELLFSIGAAYLYHRRRIALQEADEIGLRACRRYNKTWAELLKDADFKKGLDELWDAEIPGESSCRG